MTACNYAAQLFGLNTMILPVKGIAKRSSHQCRQALLVTALWTQVVESAIA
jgi:hypothetical protein